MQREQPDNNQLVTTPNLPLLTQFQKNLLKNFQDNISNSSTYHKAIAMEDIILKDVYAPIRTLLQNTKITPNIRARIMSFIMEACAKQLITRDTGALACTYIDLYFKKKGFCQVEEVQTMAISCLMLARKQHEGKLPKIDFDKFRKDSIKAWEAKVAKKLQYLLLPPTYITLGEHVVKRWDLFAQNSTQFIRKFTKPQPGPNLVLRSFYEQLDCLLLVLQTFRWDLQSVILNMFYLHAYLLNVPQLFPPHLLSDSEFGYTFYSEEKEFKLLFQKFLFSYSKQKEFSLNYQLGLYLKMFLGLNVSKKEFPVLNSQPEYKSLRVWDKLQTYNREAYQMAKGIMQRIKSG